MIIKKIALSAVLLVTLSACQSTSQNDEPLIPLPFTTPLANDIAKEVQVARIAEFLNDPELTPEQRAGAFYNRGMLYDELGLPTLARIDFNRAVKIKPNFAEVYNFLGTHYTLAMQFDKAYESFDAVIELDPEHQYAYLNRGIALYYGNRADLAVSDLNAFLQFQPNDAYRALWLYLANRERDEAAALLALKKNTVDLDQEAWSYQLVRMYLGEISEETFLNTIDKGAKNHTQYVERLCEAYFYLAKKAKWQGRLAQAEDYFNLAISTNVYQYVEHKYARLELRLMYSDEQQPQS